MGANVARFRLLPDERFVNMGNNATTGDGRLYQTVQFLYKDKFKPQ